MRWRLIVLAAVVTVAAGGCSFLDPVGVAYDDSADVMSVYLSDCDAFGAPGTPREVQRVQVVRLGTVGSPVLLDARPGEGKPSPGSVVRIADSGAPFVVTSERSVADLFDGDYDGVLVEVVVQGQRASARSEPFLVGELPRDGRVFESRGGPTRSPADYVEHQQDQCDRQWVGPVLGIGFVVVFGVVWLAGVVFWIVKLVQVARIPEYQYRLAGSDKTTWVLVVVLAQVVGALVWQFGPRRRVLAAAGYQPGPFGPPPGWYPDQIGGLAWWDGARWTGAVHRPPPPPSSTP